MSPETLRTWVRRTQVDGGDRPGLDDGRAGAAQGARARGEGPAPRQRNLEGRVGFLRDRARRSNQEVVRYIDARRDRWGVEPICRALQFAPSTYYAAKARPQCARAVRDDELMAEIQRVDDQSFDGCYGHKKVWKQLNREGIRVANCTVRRLMRAMGLSGARRGRHFKVTTRSDDRQHRPSDLVERQFTASAPNRLWVADLTYVKTHRAGSTSRSSPTCSAGPSSAGRSRRRCAATSPSTRSRWRSTRATRSTSRACPSFRQGRPISGIRYTERLDEASHRRVGGVQGRLLRQRARRELQRPRQVRVDSPQGTLAQRRGTSSG